LFRSSNDAVAILASSCAQARCAQRRPTSKPRSRSFSTSIRSPQGAPAWGNAGDVRGDPPTVWGWAENRRRTTRANHNFNSPIIVPRDNQRVVLKIELQAFDATRSSAASCARLEKNRNVDLDQLRREAQARGLRVQCPLGQFAVRRKPSYCLLSPKDEQGKRHGIARSIHPLRKSDRMQEITCRCANFRRATTDASAAIDGRKNEIFSRRNIKPFDDWSTRKR